MAALLIQPLPKSAPKGQDDDPQINSFGNPFSETDVHTSLDTQFWKGIGLAILF
jgi:hypothetical protein